MITDRAATALNYISIPLFIASVAGIVYILLKSIGLNIELLLACGAISAIFAVGLGSARIARLINTILDVSVQVQETSQRNRVPTGRKLSSEHQERRSPQWLTRPKRSAAFGSGFPLVPDDAESIHAKLKEIGQAAGEIVQSVKEIEDVLSKGEKSK